MAKNLQVDNELSSVGQFVRDEDGNTCAFAIETTGKVGIGTSRPARNLEIEDPTEGVVAITKTGSGTANDPFARIDFGLDAGGLNEYAARILAVSETNGYVDQGKAHLVSGQLQLQTMRAASGLGADEASPTTKLTITGDGDVGIGTTEPDKKLHVNGNSQIDGITQTSALKVTGAGRVLDVSGRVHAGQATHGAKPGFITIRGPNGELNIVLASTQDGSANEGVIGVLDDDGRTVAFIESEDGLGVIGVLHNDIQKAIMFVDEGKGIIEADEIRATVKHMHVPNPKQPDTDIVYTCIEGPEAAVYFRGTARLINGEAIITLPDHFASVASGQDMTVQITPLSAKSLGIAVVEKHRSQFVVKELQGGAGTYDFDWEVKSVRMGYEEYKVIRPHRKRVQKLYSTE